MTDEDFKRLLDGYLDPPSDPNPKMTNVRIIWVRDNPAYGALHIAMQHDISEQDVEDVLLQVPPEVQAKRHPDHPERTIFWGATRWDRWLVVVCEDWTEKGNRFLKPITAFEPDEESYWERQ